MHQFHNNVVIVSVVALCPHVPGQWACGHLVVGGQLDLLFLLWAARAQDPALPVGSTGPSFRGWEAYRPTKHTYQKAFHSDNGFPFRHKYLGVSAVFTYVKTNTFLEFIWLSRPCCSSQLSSLHVSVN